MHFKLAINSVVRSLFLDASGSVTSLTLICSRLEGDGVWDIGEAHALAHKDESVAKGKRHLSEVEVHIRRRSALTDEQVQRLALAPKIGEMSFYPRKEKTWDLPEFPARLSVYIFLGDLDLDGIVGAVANGEGNVTAIIFLDEHPSLGHGFKPGGPSAVWTVDDESDETSLPVNGVSIEIPIYKRKLA
jgi:hypothetical protein